MSDVLFIFAHQDDEIGALPTLRRERRNGNRIWCAYLTDGARSVNAAVRDAESTAFLGRLGIGPETIGFITDCGGRIADGTLVDNLVRADGALATWLLVNDARVERLYSLDWEGGHADHDAAHLIALSISGRVGCPLFVFSLYNAYKRPRKFFRVTDFIPDSEPVRSYGISWREALLAALAPLAFPSQRRTWLALGGGLALRILWGRSERIRSAVPARVAHLPHVGPPLYETLFGYPGERFMTASNDYRRRLLASVQTLSDR